MNESTYTDRDVEIVTVEKIDGHVTFDSGWSWGAPGVLDKLEVGRRYLYETQRFSNVTGIATIYEARDGSQIVDQWLMHKTDVDIERDHQLFLDSIAREREEQWAKHHDAWWEREKALPAPLRRRLDRFRLNGGHEFETEGWGYELIVCELAVLYAASGQEDDDAVTAFAREHGTSGNQHGYAKALSRHLTDDPADEDIVADSVSALSPITGNADYTASNR